MTDSTGSTGGEGFGYPPSWALVDDATPEQKAARARASAWAKPIKERFTVERQKRADELLSRQTAITASTKALIDRVPDRRRADWDSVLIRNEFVRLPPDTEEIEQRREIVDRLTETRGECGCGKGRPPCSDHQKLMDTRPTATKLVPVPRGVHMPLLLMAIYMAQHEQDGRWRNRFDVDTRRNSSWAQFVGYDLADPKKASHERLKEVGRQVRRALNLLAGEEHNLVRRSKQKSRPWQGWSLLNESGDGHVYRNPVERYAFPVPVEFWTRGWHLVLRPAEISCYFAMRAHHHALATPEGAGGWKENLDGDDGFYMPRPLRIVGYGMSDEVYAAHNTLADFGLIRRLDHRAPWRKPKKKSAEEGDHPEGDQRDSPSSDEGHADGPRDDTSDGTSRALAPEDKPYKFALTDRGLQRPALETVIQSLQTFRYPAWLEGPGESFIRGLANDLPE